MLSWSCRDCHFLIGSFSCYVKTRHHVVFVLHKTLTCRDKQKTIRLADLPPIIITKFSYLLAFDTKLT